MQKLQMSFLALLIAIAFTCAAAAQEMPPHASSPASSPEAIVLQPPQSTTDIMARHQRETDQLPLKTFYLTYMTEPTETQDIVNTLRTVLNLQRVTPLASRHAIVLRTVTPEQMAQAEKLITELDRPPTQTAGHAAYRLDFAISEFESGKKVNTRNYVMLIQQDHKGQFRVGSRVPVVTGSFSPSTSNATVNTQFQYLDVGVNIDCHLSGSDENNLTLDGTAEVSGVAGAGGTPGTASEPVVRQEKTSFTASIPTGKTTLLASVDEVDAPRKMEIQVTATRMK